MKPQSPQKGAHSSQSNPDSLQPLMRSKGFDKDERSSGQARRGKFFKQVSLRLRALCGERLFSCIGFLWQSDPSSQPGQLREPRRIPISLCSSLLFREIPDTQMKVIKPSKLDGSRPGRALAAENQQESLF
jgi:hypothetical protein